MGNEDLLSSFIRSTQVILRVSEIIDTRAWLRGLSDSAKWAKERAKSKHWEVRILT